MKINIKKTNIIEIKINTNLTDIFFPKNSTTNKKEVEDLMENIVEEIKNLIKEYIELDLFHNIQQNPFVDSEDFRDLGISIQIKEK